MKKIEAYNKLKFLDLRYLSEQWDYTLENAKKRNPSYYKFLNEIITAEYESKKERQRLARIKNANIEEMLVMETFPFAKQPKLKKKLVMELYDSMEYMDKKQVLNFVGPTGCGKSGLATSFLVHAINNGYRGYQISFKDLVDKLHKSSADHSSDRVIKRFLSYDPLHIDELGYIKVEKKEADHFFTLMKKRHHNKTTLITTQLGFDSWGEFLQDKHLTSALIDRITENCTIFNMKDCISIRPKKITYATQK